MNIDYQTLEFPLFKGEVCGTFASKFAAREFDRLEPKQSLTEIHSFQKDLRSIFELYHSVPAYMLENDGDFFAIYAKLSAENMKLFSPEAGDYLIIARFIISLLALKRHLESHRRHLAPLTAELDNLKPDEELLLRIQSTFEEDGSIRDGATSELKELRRALKVAHDRVQRSLQAVLRSANADKFIQEYMLVMRGGRYTLPCKANFNKYIEGYIHDRSASGQTLYVEPTSAVSAGNELQDKLLAESAEITKILAALAAQLREHIHELHTTTGAYSYLAMLIELQKFYNLNDYTFPTFGDEIRFKSIHHPLILIRKSNASIPLDLFMDIDDNLIVISGPNTGGKSAALKSIGLNHIIGMCGLPLFGVEAELLYLDTLLADIGDNQSLIMDLSTFSAHVANIKRMLESISGKTLLLCDELGTGTDPREGAALAQAVLEHIADGGAKAVITTHFSEVKGYALEHPAAKIYAVDFDYENFTPSYRLLEGVIGRSDPIMTARRLGFPSSITEVAQRRIDALKGAREVELEEISLMRAEAEHIKRTLESQRQELLEREKRIEAGEADLKQRLAKRELELLEETTSLLQRARRLANDGNKGKVKDSTEQIDEAIKGVNEKIERAKSARKLIEGLKAGDIVFLEQYSKVAQIISIEKDTAFIDLEGLKMRMQLRDIVGRRIDNRTGKNVKVKSDTTASKTRAVRRELLLVGKRVEEALDLLDKYLDESRLSGYEQVYIVHGRGSGQLRAAIHEYLKSSSSVKRYALASNEEGGNAITVVEL
ncbi:endonuclease MutS2 [Deferribacterales bacterium]|nr:endonuclease MutS2 [Deferribacterales bacterium]